MQNLEDDMLPDQNLNATQLDSTVSTIEMPVMPAPIGAVSTKANPNLASSKLPVGTNQNTAQKKTETKSIPKKQLVSIENSNQNIKTNSVKTDKAKPKALMPSVH
jgi:hypothetical protein